MNAADLATLDNVKQWLGLSGLYVASITQANPAVITLQTRPATPLLSGVAYSLAGINGMVELPAGDYVITVIDATSFSIPVDSTAFTAYTTGAVVGISDPFLANLITRVSVFLQSWLNRNIAAQAYSEYRDGTGTPTLALTNYPVQSISLVAVNGIAIPARPALGAGTVTAPGFWGWGTQPGYVASNFGVALSGGVFAQGYKNVQLAYVAGFQIANEAQTVPAVAPYTLTTMARWSAGDLGVVYAATGVALVKVAGLPALGQYSVAGDVYTFNAADASAAVLLTYAMVPFDVEQACIDTVGDWFKYVDRIGKTSQAIEGQSTQFTNTAIPARALGVLQQYKRIAPVGP